MSKFSIIAVISAFLVGMFSGAFAIITFRHEIWPISGHVKEMALYVISSVPIFVILLMWYLKVIKFCGKVLGEGLGRLINAILSFVLVTLILLFAVIIGIFFVVIT
ncbi:MAG: hypothetical protein ACE5JB_00455 [bacterium]